MGVPAPFPSNYIFRVRPRRRVRPLRSPWRALPNWSTASCRSPDPLPDRPRSRGPLQCPHHQYFFFRVRRLRQRRLEQRRLEWRRLEQRRLEWRRLEWRRLEQRRPQRRLTQRRRLLQRRPPRRRLQQLCELSSRRDVSSSFQLSRRPENDQEFEFIISFPKFIITSEFRSDFMNDFTTHE